MNFLKRMGNFFASAVEILFGALVVCILIGTMILDKRMKNPFPNTVTLPNVVYFAIAAVLLLLLCLALRARSKRRDSIAPGPRSGMTRRTYYCALAAIALVVALYEYRTSLWIPYTALDTDFKNVFRGAWSVANGGSLADFSYFRRSPNNLNITIALAWVYKLIPRPKIIVWLGALMTNASAILASLSVYNVTRRERLSLTVAIVGELLVAVTWRSFLPYTDNYGMIFVALVLWLYTSRLRPAAKVPLILLFTAMGALIKVTNIILLAAIMIYETIKWLRSEEHRIHVKRAACYVACFAVIFGSLFAAQGPIRRHYGFRPGRFPKGWKYMFMVGQNTDRVGAAGGNNAKIRDEYIEEYGDLATINRMFFKKALVYIRERGVWGNVVFYENKIDAIYNDGYFHNIQNTKMQESERNLFYEFYLKDGAYYQVGATLFQIVWDAILLTVMLYTLYEALARLPKARGGASRSAGKGEAAGILLCFKIAALSINAYLMILEGRSKYLFMFLPLYLLAFGLMYGELCDAAARQPLPRASRN